MDPQQNAEQQAFITQLYARARATTSNLEAQVQAVQDAVDAIPVPVDDGLPSGGTAGDVLVKASSDDYAASWLPRPTVIPWHAHGNASLTLTNSPIAERLVGNQRYRSVRSLDLSGYTQVRLRGAVAVASISGNTPVLRLKYKTGANANTAASYLDIGASPVSLSLSAAGHVDSGWTNLVAGAQGDVLVALTESGGDGISDPGIGWLNVELR